MTDWVELTRRAALQSHRLIGWIYWDPVTIEQYAALGPDPITYYCATRGAPLAAAGNDAVIAAFYSINPAFIALSLDQCRAHTTFAEAAAARDAGVVAGLRQFVPEICDELAELAQPLWAAADALPASGRVFFASTRAWPRPDDPLLSAWLAVNCIREWRGDTHWAIQIAEDIGQVECGILDGAWRAYDDDWLARSRGADAPGLEAALATLEPRGLAEGGRVNQRGVDYRQGLEDRLDELTSTAWKAVGEDVTRQFVALMEPAGAKLLERIDVTAGPNWMPAGRDHPRHGGRADNDSETKGPA